MAMQSTTTQVRLGDLDDVIADPDDILGHTVRDVNGEDLGKIDDSRSGDPATYRRAGPCRVASGRPALTARGRRCLPGRNRRRSSRGEPR
jgi:hypothetical protein